MAPPAKQRNKLRTALIVVAALAFVAVLATVLANTADSGNKKPAATKPKPKPPRPHVALVIGPVAVETAGLPATVKAPVRRAVLSSTQRYLDDAVLAPLGGAAVDNAYASVFDPGVRKQATGRDRAVLTETMKTAPGRKVKVTASPVRIDALSDQAGQLALVATTFTLTAKATTPAGRPLTIRRHTELTFMPEANRWKVTAYRVSVRRTVGRSTTSTTAHAGTVAPK